MTNREALSKIYKTIERNDITIYGSDRPIKVLTNTRGNDYFTYKDKRYYLGEFTSTKFYPIRYYPSEWMKEFDGYLHDSFFSGVLVKMGDDAGTVKAYTFII